MTGLPENIVGFKAKDNVTKEDFDNVVFPAVDELIKRTGELNYMMVLDTDISNFTIGAWWKDAVLGLKNLSKFHHVAIVSESKAINKFTDMFSVLVPGEYKGYTHAEMDQAISWVAENK